MLLKQGIVKWKKTMLSVTRCVLFFVCLFVLGQALEYARTIAKPKVLPRPNKEAQKRQAGTGAQALVQVQTRYLSGGDVGHLTLLESLRQRHEQEKQAVAQFKAVHAI